MADRLESRLCAATVAQIKANADLAALGDNDVKIEAAMLAKLCEMLLEPPYTVSETRITNAAQPGEVMENQHQQIKGYRDLTQAEIDAMNEIKAMAVQAGQLVEKLRGQGVLDQRWVSIGATDLQTGFMALTRSVAKPTTF